MVQFVNCFEVPAGREDEFFTMWLEVNAYMKQKPGYVSHRLLRSLSPEAGFRFVNYADWESAPQWTAAHDDGFRSLMRRPEWRDFRSTPALYEVVHEGAQVDAVR